LRSAPLAHEERHVTAGIEQPSAKITANCAPAPTTRIRMSCSLHLV